MIYELDQSTFFTFYAGLSACWVGEHSLFIGSLVLEFPPTSAWGTPFIVILICLNFCFLQENKGQTILWSVTFNKYSNCLVLFNLHVVAVLIVVVVAVAAVCFIVCYTSDHQTFLQFI